MEAKQTGRVIFIVAVLLAAVFCICPQPQKLFQHLPWSQKLNLKPGIDMVGGTSLLYEIKDPPGGYHGQAGHTLAEDVMDSLKKRVDPDGLRNLIWRPQGNNRLEIQLPASADSDEAKTAREKYAAAQQELDATNVRSGEVLNAVEQLTGDARQARLNQLAGTSAVRQKLFAQLTTVYDQLQDAHAKKNADLEAQKTDEYEGLKNQLEQSNLSVSQMETVLDTDADKRTVTVDDLKKNAGGYTDRLKAIDNFVAAYASYSKVKGSINDAAQLKQLLRGSGVLEFHIAARGSDVPPTLYQAMVARLQKDGPRVEAGDQVQWFPYDRPEEASSADPVWNGKPYVLCWITADKSMVNGPNSDHWALESAYRDQDRNGGAAVGFQFDPVGSKYFGDLTGNNKDQLLTTILSGKVISTAKVNDRINGRGSLTNEGQGGYNDQELSYLISTLNAGSLPAQLEDEPVSEHTVGSQLGEDNLKAGFIACAFGLVIVAVFLVCYYYVAGIVATFAVFMNVLLILGILAAFNATFTLPGIAGIVLTIGAAVDANVLIFERLREEQHLGLGIRMAMRNAYKHATSAIIDSNATTVITSIILIWLGSEEVKGFGLTLLIGLCCSLFTALFVTRTIFNILIDRFNIQNLGSLPLTYPKWDAFLKPNIDWMKLVPYFLGFSAVFIVIGLTALGIKAEQRQLADIDFSSGTQVQFELKQATPIGDLRDVFSKAQDPVLPPTSVTIVSVGNDNKTYEIVTPDVNVKAVRTAVLNVLGDRLKVDLPSKFDHVGEPLEAAIGSNILPVTKSPFVVNGFTVPGSENYLGGAAIVLSKLDPPLRVGEIKDRIDRQRLQSTGGPASQYHDFIVVSPTGNDQPTATAIILTSDTTLPYDKDESKWREELVRPMWQLVNDSINRQAQLQKVNNFDAQVAGDTQRAAVLSLVLSSIVIMVYIWFRFGNLKYGTATVLAMIHDTLLVLGAIGLSHYLVQWTPPLARLLLVEPFRINLTIVAAVLTVMSYSMIDTIVVFDRIRENRGRFGHMSRKIVNDSINQTLSRTLLTAGTTIITVAGMYVVGGPGIHGFTFVLLIGILVGTYSSIAIAAPILLMGNEVAEENSAPRSGRSLVGSSGAKALAAGQPR